MQGQKQTEQYMVDKRSWNEQQQAAKRTKVNNISQSDKGAKGNNN